MNGHHYRETDLRNACHVLFGTELELSRDFFFYLQPEGIKTAFRLKAKETHPDSVKIHCQGVGVVPEDFHRVSEAYRILSSFVRQRDCCTVSDQPRQPDPGPQYDFRQPCYHQGGLPSRRLELGRYLYYLGIIPYQAILAAVIWQRNQRPSVGRIARSWGWLSDESVQKVLSCRKHSGQFGDKAIGQGLLTKHQLSLLLAHQRLHQQKIGSYFVKSGYLSVAELEHLVRQLHIHNARH